jgi:hypothetical protein
MNSVTKGVVDIFHDFKLPLIRGRFDVAMIVKMKNDRHQGFARGHPPYYWPGLGTLNFLDLTG